MIGLFNDSFPPVLDGVTLVVQNYVDHLVEAGQKVTVVTPWNPKDLEHPHYEMHRYFSLPIYNRHPYRYGYPLLDPWIWHNIRKTRFDLVHAHCPFSSGRLAMYAAKYHKVPLIATFHSKYKSDLVRSLPKFMVDYQMKRLLQFYNSAYEVWIPQAAVEETLREYGFKGKVQVVENGNDFLEGVDNLEQLKLDARKELGVNPGTLKLLFVGQHILEKGIDIIVQALSLIPHDIDYRMDFIGTGYALGQMQRLVRSLNLGKQVTFHGVTQDRNLLKKHYASADLFLFPSFYDNAPLVVREAAAMGTPSILLLGSTAAENIQDHVNGFLVERTPKAYADKIGELFHNRELITQVGLGARSTLARPWSDVVREVSERYQTVMDRFYKEFPKC